jgi:hypothetical protein
MKTFTFIIYKWYIEYKSITVECSDVTNIHIFISARMCDKLNGPAHWQSLRSNKVRRWRPVRLEKTGNPGGSHTQNVVIRLRISESAGDGIPLKSTPAIPACYLLLHWNSLDSSNIGTGHLWLLCHKFMAKIYYPLQGGISLVSLYLFTSAQRERRWPCFVFDVTRFIHFTLYVTSFIVFCEYHVHLLVWWPKWRSNWIWKQMHSEAACPYNQ